MFYSVTSHGQLGAARACARHVCSRLGLLASSSPNITENTDILYCRINMRCKGEGMGVSGGQRGKSSLTGAMVRYGHIDANTFGFSHLVVAVDKSHLTTQKVRNHV